MEKIRSESKKNIVRQPSVLYILRKFGLRALSGGSDARILNPAAGLRSKLLSTVSSSPVSRLPTFSRSALSREASRP